MKRNDVYAVEGECEKEGGEAVRLYRLVYAPGPAPTIEKFLCRAGRRINRRHMQTHAETHTHTRTRGAK
jgi:hypothetical protein